MGSSIGHGAADLATSTAHVVAAAPAAVASTANAGAHEIAHAGAGAAQLATKVTAKGAGGLAHAASGAAHLTARLPQVAAARHVVHSAGKAVKAARNLPSAAAHGAHAAARLGHGVSHAAHGVANLGRRAGSRALSTARKVATAPVTAARAGAHYVNKHSRGIAYGLGAAALVTTVVPGLQVLTPALALGAAGFSALNTYKDVKGGASGLQTAFDAAGVLPGAGAVARLTKANKLAKGVVPTAAALRKVRTAQHVVTGSKAITAGRVAVTTARNVRTELSR